jgi:hypothetical protein
MWPLYSLGTASWGSPGEQLGLSKESVQVVHWGRNPAQCTFLSLHICQYCIILRGCQLALIKVGEDVFFKFVIGNLEWIGCNVISYMVPLIWGYVHCAIRAGCIVLLLDYTVLIVSNIYSPIRLFTIVFPPGQCILYIWFGNIGCLLLLYPNQICTLFCTVYPILLY